MANEIAISANVNAAKGSTSVTRTLSKNIDWALARDSLGVQSIPAAVANGTPVVFGAGVATLGYAWFVNLDATNFVDLGVRVGGTLGPMVRLLKGEFGVFPLTPGITIYALADTAAVDLEFGVINR